MKIKELRKNAKLTQNDLCKAININQQNLSRYESGEVEPNIETLTKLADYFDVSIDFLVERRQFNRLDMSNLTQTQKNIINMVIELNEINANRVESYIIAKLEEQEENKQNFKKQVR